jgi:hypothetical protein
MATERTNGALSENQFCKIVNICFDFNRAAISEVIAHARIDAVLSNRPAPTCSKCGNTLGCVSCYNEAHAPKQKTAEERLEEIRQVEEEIVFTKIILKEGHESCGVDGCGCEDPFKRIVVREQAALAELKRGMQ